MTRPEHDKHAELVREVAEALQWESPLGMRVGVVLGDYSCVYGEVIGTRSLPYVTGSGEQRERTDYLLCLDDGREVFVHDLRGSIASEARVKKWEEASGGSRD